MTSEITALFSNFTQTKILLALVVINSFVILFCLVIDLIKKILHNNSTCVKVIINQGIKQLSSSPKVNLLSALLSNKIYLPSACGGKGTCGLCKVKVKYFTKDTEFSKNISAPSPIEKNFLSYFEIKNGYRLACQFKPHKDIEIIIEPKYFEVIDYLSTVVETKHLNKLVKIITLKLDEPNNIKFKAGQYIQIIYPENKEKIANNSTNSTNIELEEPILRAYSIYNAPNTSNINTSTNKIQIVVKKVENGLVSNWLHSLNVGDKLKFIGPFGDFCIDDIQDSAEKMYNFSSKESINCVDYVFIAGGVGIVPIRSIIVSLLQKLYGGFDELFDPARFLKNNLKELNFRIFLFYGGKDIESLIDHDFFYKIAKDLSSHFYYFPTIEIAPNDKNIKWEGYLGIITDVFDKNFEAIMPVRAFVCGPPKMVQNVIKIMTSKGISEKDIKYDKF